MKVILDESAPQKLRYLTDHRHFVVSIWFQGWSGLKNGVLLSAEEEAGFELFITADQELSYQQNLTKRRIVREQIAQINDAIDACKAGDFTFVDIGHARG